MRGHVARSTSTQSASSRRILITSLSTSSGLVDRSHSILEGTASSKVLATANTTLDLLVLQLILHTALLATVLLRLSRLKLPVDAGPENNVLTHGGRIERRSGRVALLQTELGPGPPLRDLRVDMFAHNGRFDPAGHLHLLAFVVESVGDDRLRAIFVGRDLLRGESGGVVELLVVGPVGAAGKWKKVLVRFSFFLFLLFCRFVALVFWGWGVSAYFPSFDIVRVMGGG